MFIIIQLSCYTLSSRHNTAYWNSKTAEEGKTQVLILQIKNSLCREHAFITISTVWMMGMTQCRN